MSTVNFWHGVRRLRDLRLDDSDCQTVSPCSQGAPSSSFVLLRRTREEDDMVHMDVDGEQQPIIDFASTIDTSTAIQQRHRDLISPVNESRVNHGFFSAARRRYREPQTRHDLGRMEVLCRWCGASHG